MKFVLEITELDNAAFSGDEFYGPRESELMRIINRVAEDVFHGERSGVCRDINGNKVGKFEFIDEEEQ